MCIYTRQRELTFLGVYAKILIKNLTCFGFHFPLGFSRAYRMLVKLHFRHFPLQSSGNNNGAPNGKRKAAQRVAMVNNILPWLFTSPLPPSLPFSLPPSLSLISVLCSIFHTFLWAARQLLLEPSPGLSLTFFPCCCCCCCFCFGFCVFSRFTVCSFLIFRQPR